MARCHACDEEIGYGAFVVGVTKRFGRNVWRRTLPIFDCPSCGVECQEQATTAYGFILVSAAVGALAALALLRAHVNVADWTFAACGLVLLLAMHSGWWRWVSRTKEPHQFFWE